MHLLWFAGETQSCLRGTHEQCDNVYGYLILMKSSVHTSHWQWWMPHCHNICHFKHWDSFGWQSPVIVCVITRAVQTVCHCTLFCTALESWRKEFLTRICHKSYYEGASNIHIRDYSQSWQTQHYEYKKLLVTRELRWRGDDGDNLPRYQNRRMMISLIKLLQ